MDAGSAKRRISVAACTEHGSMVDQVGPVKPVVFEQNVHRDANPFRRLVAAVAMNFPGYRNNVLGDVLRHPILLNDDLR